MRKGMRDQTSKYLEELKKLQRVAPKEDVGFFDFVVKQEEVQIDALHFWVDGNYKEAAELLKNFMEENH